MDKNRTALLAAVIGNSIFGFSFLFSKIGLGYAGPVVLIAFRFTVAFLMLNAIVFLGRRIRRRDGSPLVTFSLKDKPKRDILLLAVFQPIIYFIAENVGIQYTSSSFAGVIIAVIPIACIVFDITLLRSNVTRRQVICAVCSVIGVALTTAGARDMNSSLKGFLLLLVAVISGALYYVYSKKTSADYSPLERTYVMFGAGCAFYLTFALITGVHDFDGTILAPLREPAFITSILYLGIVSSVLAFLLINYASSIISISRTSLYANLTTVISILAGVVLLKERFTLCQGIGAAIILASVSLAS